MSLHPGRPMPTVMNWWRSTQIHNPRSPFHCERAGHGRHVVLDGTVLSHCTHTPLTSLCRGLHVQTLFSRYSLLWHLNVHSDVRPASVEYVPCIHFEHCMLLGESLKNPCWQSSHCPPFANPFRVPNPNAQTQSAKNQIIPLGHVQSDKIEFVAL